MSADGIDFDVVIVGSGVVGATAAALLARHGRVPAARIALLAPDAQPSVASASDGEPQLRVSAISPASRKVLQQADAWQRMDERRLCAYECMRVWHESMPPDGLATLAFDAAELALPELGFIVENAALTRAALASFAETGGRLLATTLQSLSGGDQAMRLETAAGEYRARLVVGADGAQSLVRAQLQIPVRSHAYQQQAIIATVVTAKPHQHTAWQRFLASGPLALLPLFDGSSSLVWSVSNELAAELMALSPELFQARLEAASDAVLGRITLTSQRAAIPLQRATANDLVAPRVALIGDAAHQVHPLAGQGVNLGLLDAASLCEVVADAVSEREDPGALRALRRYEQQRRTHDTLISWTMSAFNTLFSQGGGAGWAAARMLGLAGATGVGRRLLARRAMGLAGELPRLAR